MQPLQSTRSPGGVVLSHNRLLLIGPVTPPIGGVSIHIERLRCLVATDFQITLLDESRTIKPAVLNIRRMSPVRYLSRIIQSDIVHVHSGPSLLKFIHTLAARLLGKK